MPARNFTSEFQRGSLRDREDLVVRLNAAAPFAISKPVVTAIFSQVNEGLQRGGAEIGGLLVGPRASNGSVLVDEVVRIETRSQFGSSFSLEPGELTDLEHTIKAVPASKTVVGVYRSRLQGDDRLRESDREIFRVMERAHASFANDFRFFVQFDPISRFAMCAGIGCRDGADWKEWRQFTMRIHPSGGNLPEVEVWTEDRPATARAGAATFSEDSEAGTHAESPRILNLTPEPDTPDVGEKPASSRSERVYKHSFSAKRSFSVPKPAQAPWKPLAAAAIVILVLSVAYGLFRARRRPPVDQVRSTAPAPVVTPAPNSRAGFSASPENSMWKLTWNRDAVASLHPTAAVLSIQDGGQERKISLSSPDLATGVAFYSPRTGDLLFSLRIDVPGGDPVEEHVRVLQADRGAVRSADEAPAQIAAGELVTRSLRPFAPPTAGPSSKPAREENHVAEIPAPPPLPVSSTPALSASTLPAPAGPPLRAPNPAPPSPTSATARIRPASYSPPQAILQVSPNEPPNLPPGIGSVVHIQVEIDETGKVTRANPTGLTASNFPLVAAATQAAKNWRFRPALADGHPVPSKMDLTFKFSAK